MSVKPFSVMSLGKMRMTDPSKVSYEDAITILTDEFHRQRRSFVKVGFYLKHIRENQLYLEEGYNNINDFAFEKFNLSQSTTSRYIKICEQFSINGNSPELDERFTEYNLSQLMEMIPLDKNAIEQIHPGMSVKDIREIKVLDKSREYDDQEIQIPGQTNIEVDFPEYMPNSSSEDCYATSHKEEGFFHERKAEKCMVQFGDNEDFEGGCIEEMPGEFRACNDEEDTIRISEMSDKELLEALDDEVKKMMEDATMLLNRNNCTKNKDY